jgi:hypothetical protein
MTLRARALRGNWQPQFPRIVISLSWRHVTERSSANWGNSLAKRLLSCLSCSHYRSPQSSSPIPTFLCSQWSCIVSVHEQFRFYKMEFILLLYWRTYSHIIKFCTTCTNSKFILERTYGISSCKNLLLPIFCTCRRLLLRRNSETVPRTLVCSLNAPNPPNSPNARRRWQR